MDRSCVLLLWLCAACGGGPAAHDAGPDARAKDAAAGMSGGGGTGGQPVADAGPTDAGFTDGSVCIYDPNAPPPSDCPSDVPSTCDGAAPSYKDSVSQTFASRCSACHRVGGMAADKPFDSYKHVYPLRRTILFELSDCKMPLACAPQPTLAEREELLKWLVCGAPEN